MDLGQGREFELLQALLQSNMLGLIDLLAIRWRYQLAVRFSVLHVLGGACCTVQYAFSTAHYYAFYKAHS